MDIINNAMATGKSVVMAGECGSGRTTDAETVKTFVASGRIIGIEDYAELKITEAEAARILVNQK
ncbi:MAG TPA: hypothetical protein VF450_00645 [Noviherbaspirillum sp.]